MEAMSVPLRKVAARLNLADGEELEGLFYVAVPTDAGLLLYRRDADANWSMRNLTVEDPLSYPIASQLLAFEATNGLLRHDPKSLEGRTRVCRVVGQLDF